MLPCYWHVEEPLNRRRGFTLIELLVVIAIIAILAAILFPIFVRAQKAAKTSACLSNQKQLVSALLLYADQAGGGFFPYTTKTGTKALFPSYPTTGTDAINTDISGELIHMMGSYVRNKKVFYCTVVEWYSKRYTYNYQSTEHPTDNPPSKAFQYVGYYYYAGEGWAGTKITLTGSPKRILMSCIGGGVGNSATNEGVSGHEKGRGIFTFADGHCKLVHHFYYPYSGTESKKSDGSYDLNKLLMPRWPKE